MCLSLEKRSKNLGSIFNSTFSLPMMASTNTLRSLRTPNSGRLKSCSSLFLVAAARKTPSVSWKTILLLGYVLTNTYQANSAYFQVSQMAYNLSLSLQHDMGLVQKHSTNPKRPRLYQSWKWKTFRFLILNRAGRIAWEQGTKVLYFIWPR